MAEKGQMDGLEQARVDLWLWAVRIFRSRSLASAACRAGRVRVNGASAKPARAVRAGDRVEVTRGALTKTLEVRAVLKRRVGAKLVADYLDDLTPAEVYEQAARQRKASAEGGPVRSEGSGRPTKRERRDLSKLAEEAAEREAAVEELMRKSID